MILETTLLTSGEKKRIAALGPGFIEDYVEYARRITDAPWEYHVGVGFSILSAVVGPFAYDPLYRARPNMWILLLGPSSSFRKTTSLNIGMNLLRHIDKEMFVATDFSPQALIGDIAVRNNRASLFVRDEVSGLFRLMKGASYMAGIKELLIKLFDGDSFTRRLRSEEIVVKDPYFVWIGGGVEDKLMESVEEDDIFSGFLIRFCLIRPLTRGLFRPISYEPVTLDEVRESLLFNLRDIREKLNLRSNFMVASRVMEIGAPTWFTLSSDALQRFNHYLEDLETFHSPTPLHEKLNSRIGPMCMKLAILLHCSHRMWNRHWLNTAEIDNAILLKAIMYAELFRTHTARVLSNVGVIQGERLIDHIVVFIKKKPGINRASIMRRFKLRSRQMDELKSTMLERHLVKVEVHTTGTKPGELYFPWSANGNGLHLNGSKPT